MPKFSKGEVVTVRNILLAGVDVSQRYRIESVRVDSDGEARGLAYHLVAIRPYLSTTAASPDAIAHHHAVGEDDLAPVRADEVRS